MEQFLRKTVFFILFNIYVMFDKSHEKLHHQIKFELLGKTRTRYNTIEDHRGFVLGNKPAKNNQTF